MDLNSCSLCFSWADLWPLLDFLIHQGMSQKRLKEAAKTVLLDLDFLFLKEQKQEGNGFIVYTSIYTHIYSPTEQETYQCKTLRQTEWSMKNRLTTEAAVTRMQRHTMTPQHQLSSLKGGEGPGPVLQTLADFSKFTFTGVNLKGLFPGMQD